MRRRNPRHKRGSSWPGCSATYENGGHRDQTPTAQEAAAKKGNWEHHWQVAGTAITVLCSGKASAGVLRGSDMGASAEDSDTNKTFRKQPEVRLRALDVSDDARAVGLEVTCRGHV